LTQPITFLDGRVSLYLGDVRAMLALIPSDSVDCVVTSPPYWGLRDYGTGRWEGGDPDCDHRSPTMRDGRNEDRAKLAGSAATNSYQLRLAHNSACGKCGAVKVDQQLGLEPTLGEHLAAMVDVFREVRRVLKPEGTCWVNYGDCYATSPNGRSAADTKAGGNDDRTFRDKPFSTIQGVLKAKDLCMVPNRLAIALQEDGWWVRSEIIWAKSNPMPDSSGAYRPGTAHEKIFMLTKSAESDLYRARDTGELRYDPDLSERCEMVTTGELGPRWIRMPHYFDAAAVRVQRSDERDHGEGGRTAYGRHTLGDAVPPAARRGWKMHDGWDTGPGGHGSFHRAGREKGKKVEDKQRGHSRRHAGFNDRWDQMERAEQIANGRFLRNYEPAPLEVWEIATQPFADAHFATFPPELAARCIKAGCPKGGVVLDIFGGAGTTALVAARLGRKAILVELNPEYADIAQKRIERDWMGEEERRAARTPQQSIDALPLFGTA
jgi:DNA modification methylase